MLQRITDTVAGRFGWEFVSLVRIEPEGGRFVCEAVSTELPTAVKVGYGRELGSGVVGQVAATGQSILLDDVRDFPNYFETLPGALSEVCVPVRHRGRVVALLNVESPRRAAFHGQLPLLETVAEQVAGAIANARLYQETQRRAAELEMLNELSRAAVEASELRPLLARITRDVQRRFHLTVVAVVLTDSSGERFELTEYSGPALGLPIGSHWPRRAGMVGRAIHSGQVQFAHDVDSDLDYLPLVSEVRAELVVPIRHRDSILGAFSFQSEDPAVFSPQMRTILELLADQVAGAIHRAAVNRRLSEAGAALEEANRRLREANESLQLLSLQDGLTDIANRRHFDDSLIQEWRRARRQESPLALVFLDIDGFKEFNDSQGHLEGDRCLRTVAALLQASLQRAGDLAARYGGDEFAVLLSGCDAVQAEAVAESLRRRVAELRIPHPASRSGSLLTISAGVAALVPTARQAASVLTKRADEALYAAKRSGRNRVVRAPDLPRDP